MGLVILATTALGTLAAVYGRSRAYRAKLAAVAAERDLEYVDATWTHYVEVRGQIDGFPVHLKRVNSGDEQGLRVRVDGLPLDLQLHVEGFDVALAKALGGLDIQIGVPTVDRQLRIRAERASTALACLHERAREQAVALITSRSIWVKGGGVVIVVRRGSVNKLVDAIDRGVRLAKALALGEMTVSERLLHGLAHDPAPGYRRRCLEVLLQEETSLADKAARVAIDQHDPEQQLLAAAHLREVARLCRLIDSAEVAPLIRARAAEELAKIAPDEIAAREPALIAMLSPEATAVAAPIVRALATCGSAEAVQPLYALSKGGLSVPTSLKQLARRAIAMIQDRLGEGGRGGLAVLEDDREGALSPADDAPRGGLSAAGPGDRDS